MYIFKSGSQVYTTIYITSCKWIPFVSTTKCLLATASSRSSSGVMLTIVVIVVIVVIVDVLVVVATVVGVGVGVRGGGLLSTVNGVLSTLVLGLVLGIDTGRVVIKVHVAEQNVKTGSQDSAAERSMSHWKKISMKDVLGNSFKRIYFVTVTCITTAG